jgi:hypothetical protein
MPLTVYLVYKLYKTLVKTTFAFGVFIVNKSVTGSMQKRMMMWHYCTVNAYQQHQTSLYPSLK